MTYLIPTSKGDITIRVANPEDTISLLSLRLEALTMLRRKELSLLNPTYG